VITQDQKPRHDIGRAVHGNIRKKKNGCKCIHYTGKRYSLHRQTTNLTGANAVAYQVYATALGSAAAEGNIYSAAISIPANTIFEVYSGAGNKVTVTGAPFTALELGTASSAQEGVIGGGA
jgi:hypothetical protein